MADLEWMLHVSVLYMQYQHMKSLNLDRAAATLRSDAEATLKVNISPEHLKYLPLEPGILSNLAREERPLLKLVSLGLQQLSQGQALPSNGNGEDDHDTWQLSVTVLFMQCEHLHALGLPSTGSILKMDVEQTLNVQLSPHTPKSELCRLQKPAGSTTIARCLGWSLPCRFQPRSLRISSPALYTT